MRTYSIFLIFIFISVKLFGQNAKEDLKKMSAFYQSLSKVKITYTQEVLESDNLELKGNSMEGQILVFAPDSKVVLNKEMDIYEWDNKVLLIDKSKKEITLFGKSKSKPNAIFDQNKILENVDGFIKKCKKIEFKKINKDISSYKFQFDNLQTIDLEFNQDYFITKMSFSLNQDGETKYLVRFSVKDASKDELEKRNISKIIKLVDKKYQLTNEYHNYHFVNLL